MKLLKNVQPIPPLLTDGCLYIYTIPKAGTYLLSSAFEESGVPNSGFHISFNSYLDTLAFSHEMSRSTPSSTRVPSQYIKTFKKCSGKLAFGHLSPSFLPPGLFRKTSVVTAFRDPIEVLISEYNDFRNIRTDVQFCSKEEEPDEIRAFSKYLQRQGPVIRDIMIEMCRYIDSFTHPLYGLKFSDSRPVIIDFNQLKNQAYLKHLDASVHELLPQAAKPFSHALLATYGKQTKTKSSGYSFDPKALWTAENESLIKPLRLRRLHRQLIEQDKIIRNSQKHPG